VHDGQGSGERGLAGFHQELTSVLLIVILRAMG
jgi:hypothetical protein